MKREVFAAIAIGTCIGLVFTYGIWIANKSLKQAGIKSPQTNQIVQNSPSPTQAPNLPIDFTITSPEANLLTNQKSIVVSGQRAANSAIIILSENSQYILPASESSAFSQSVNLDTGFNRIKIISLNTDGRQTSADRLVTYSNTASLFTNVVSSPTVSPQASPSNTLRDSVKEKVAQEIAQIRQNSSKKAYLGSLVSSSEASFTLKIVNDNFKQITTTAETVFRLKDNSEGTIKDLKPGNFLLAMGDADANGNLSARRILVLDQPKDDNRLVLQGSVSAFTSKTLTVDKTVLNISKETLFLPAKYRFKDVDPGFKLIVVYTPSTTPLIFVVSEK